MKKLGWRIQKNSMAWQTKKLGEICDVLDSQRKPVTQRDRVSGEYPYYGATGIQDYVNEYIFDEKLILIGEDGAKWGEGEKTAFIADGKYWVNNHAHVIRPHRDVVLDNWIIYFLFVNDLSRYITGLTVQKLNQAQLRSIELPIPPLAEQKKILKILDEAFEKITKAKENAEKNLQNSKELFESYLSEIFNNLEAGCSSVELGEICKRVSVGHVGLTTEFYCEPSLGVPFIRSQNVRPGKLDWRGMQYITRNFHLKLKKSRLEKNDLLFVRVGANRGDCCVLLEEIDEVNCANIVFARLKEGDVGYVELFCRSHVGRRQLLGMSVGAAQGVINTKSVAGLKIPYPTLRIQNSIVEKMHEFSEQTKKLEANYKQKIANLDELKKSLLTKAFAGEL